MPSIKRVETLSFDTEAACASIEHLRRVHHDAKYRLIQLHMVAAFLKKEMDDAEKEVIDFLGGVVNGVEHKENGIHMRLKHRPEKWWYGHNKDYCRMSGEIWALRKIMRDNYGKPVDQSMRAKLRKNNLMVVVRMKGFVVGGPEKDFR